MAVMQPPVPFEPTGFAHLLFHFKTESWSKPQTIDKETGKVALYEVMLDADKREVVCSCMDAYYRKKNYLPISDPRLCKHSAFASEYIWPILARALGVPQTVGGQS